jgi:hypothetical protein
MPFLIVYLVGVTLGCVVMRDRWPTRITTSLVWPLGPMAFVVVLSMLLVTAAILWPVPVLGSAVLLGALIAWLT